MTTRDDLPERLRIGAKNADFLTPPLAALLREAAEEIERLSAPPQDIFNPQSLPLCSKAPFGYCQYGCPSGGCRYSSNTKAPAPPEGSTGA